MKTKEKIILVGGGGHCEACIDVIEQHNVYEIVAVVDKPEKVGQTILSYPIKYVDEDLPYLAQKYCNFFITVGQIESVELRIRLFNLLKKYNVNFPTIISPLAYVSKHTQILEGTIIMHHAMVNAGVSIGINSIINSKALVEHDSIVGNFCHISTGAILNGGVTIGDNSFVGSNAVIVQNTIIPQNSFIKAGSLTK